MRILGALGGIIVAIASFIVGLFERLCDVVPVFRGFSPRIMAGAACALIVVLIGVGVAFGGPGEKSAPAPEVAEVSLSSEESEQAAPAPSAVNPNEPEDLVWRDADFAVDPSFHGWTNKDNGRKTIFLTVDDGPSELTEKYLDVFDKYGVKATFFVTGHDPQYYHMIQEAYNRGHTIGLHSMTHDYAQIYTSEEAFFKDLDEVGQVVKDQIGYVPCFIRFPGGSSNTQAENYSRGLMPKLVNSVQARGYQYYDWSLASGDGEVHSTDELIAISTQPDAMGFDPTTETNIVLLCHDSATKQTTLEALPTIIEFFQKKGYSFEAIDRKTWVCHHTVYNPEPEEPSTGDDESTDEGQYDSEEEYYDEEEWSEGEQAA